MHQKVILDQLRKSTKEMIEIINTQFLPLDRTLLNKKPSREKWSITECIEHLNLTLKIYLPQMTAAVNQSEKYPAQKESFNHSLLGKLAVKAMKPKPDKSIGFKMKTFQNLNPESIQQDSNSILKEFVDYQQQTLEVIKKAKSIDLKKPKINTAAGSWLKLNMGDALHFMVAHNQRHLLQAQKVLQIIQ